MELLASKRYSNHPDDSYLSIVLCRNKSDRLTPYVTHIYNSTLAGGDGGYVEGHYCETEESAIEDFTNRGRG